MLPPEKQHEVLDFTEFLQARTPANVPRKPLRGLWKDLAVSITGMASSTSLSGDTRSTTSAFRVPPPTSTSGLPSVPTMPSAFRSSRCRLVPADAADHQDGRSTLAPGDLTTISGVEFADCYSRRLEAELDGVTVNFIQLDDLKRHKRASGRLKDRVDLEQLP